MNVLKDSYNRRIDYLRVSVTDRCNLRCLYCTPSKKQLDPSDEVLSFEEIERIVKVAARLGVRKVRITGGEPLVRRGIEGLIRKLRSIEGVKDISMTTNGLFLEEKAFDLKEAGLDRVNVSLDSLMPERFKRITGGGEIERVLRGIERAHEVGLVPIKLNVVVIRGINDDEIISFANLTKLTDYQVRFIEFMPGKDNNWSEDSYVPVTEIKSIIEKMERIVPVKMTRHGPARYYRFVSGRGVIGFISAISEHFCGECNRLRITADGKLRPCLFSDREIDLKGSLRRGCSDSELADILRYSVEIKPEKHRIREERAYIEKLMSKIGG